MNCFLANGQELEFYEEVAGTSPWPRLQSLYQRFSPFLHSRREGLGMGMGAPGPRPEDWLLGICFAVRFYNEAKVFP